MSELYDSIDYENLNFKYVDKKNNDVSFYGYMNSKECFNSIKSSRIKISDAKNKQIEFLNKLNNIKIGGKNSEQKKVINNLEKIDISREETINFFRDYTELLSDANYNAKKNETGGKGFKILTPKQMLERLPIALAQVKVGNNSEKLLNEIRQIVYSLYSSKQVTKKVYNNIIKFINI